MSARYAATPGPALTVTRTPHGACCSRWSTSAWRARTGSSPGAVRRATSARAEGTSTPAAASTDGRVEADHGDRGGGPEPRGQRAGADQLDAVEDTGVRAQPLLGEVQGRGLRAHETLDRDVPPLVVEGREQPDQRGQRVGHRPAVDALVDGVLEGAHLDGRRDAAAQRGGEGRDAHPPVRRVGEDEGVGGEPVVVLGEQRARAWATRSPPRPRRAP